MVGKKNTPQEKYSENGYEKQSFSTSQSKLRCIIIYEFKLN